MSITTGGIASTIVDAPRSALQLLADELLGQRVEHWVAERRARKRSWRVIALDLRDVTDRRVTVTEQTLRTWARQDSEVRSPEEPEAVQR